jgi:hypothetical protein
MNITLVIRSFPKIKSGVISNPAFYFLLSITAKISSPTLLIPKYGIPKTQYSLIKNAYSIPFTSQIILGTIK